MKQTPRPMGLNDIGRFSGKKFVMQKYESKHHLITDWPGFGDCFGLRSDILHQLKAMDKIILIIYHKSDGSVTAYVSTPQNWIQKGKIMKLGKFEVQCFLCLDNFMFTLYDGSPDQVAYRKFMEQQKTMEEFV